MPLFGKKKKPSPDSDEKRSTDSIEAWPPEIRSDLERVAANDPSLTVVNWDDELIGDGEVIRLAEVLRDNTHVTELYLAYNMITDVGAKALAEVLRTNGTVTSLDLYGNKITDAGAKALAEVLRVNGTVTALGLSRNNISADLEEKVHRLMKINKKASSPHEVFGQKVKLAVSSEHGFSEDVVTLAQAGLERFPESEHFKDLAPYVDLETGRNLYGLAAERGAGAALVSLLRAHPSLCEHRDEEDERGGLYPFMLLATVPTVGVGDVFEVLLLKPDLVACGIKALQAHGSSKRSCAGPTPSPSSSFS